jgi:hypothetical protein
VADLVSTIFRKAMPKRMGSTVLTGPILAGLTGAYVKAINMGAVPAIATAWQVGGRRGGQGQEQHCACCSRSPSLGQL